MDKITFYVTIALFGIIFISIFNFFYLAVKTTKQTKSAVKEIKSEIKNKLIEKLISIGFSKTKNICKCGGSTFKKFAGPNGFDFSFFRKNKTSEKKEKTPSKKKTKSVKKIIK
ncbi:MAG: hypothetical protein WC534_01220 [Candidatus Paceibacterota bacterium]